MPELPEVETVRRGLQPVMEGARILSVEKRRPDLRFPFPPDFIDRLSGRKIISLGRRAKYLTADIEGGPLLICHLGMSGSFRIEGEDGGSTPGIFHHERSKASAHDHVVFHLALPVGGKAKVVFNDPRRFGFMLFSDAGNEHPMLSGLGVEPTGNTLDGALLAGLLRGKKAPLKAALLDQTLIAGLGNIYVSEALWRAGFVDFDSLYGHRRDVAGYAAALEAFDRRLPEALALLAPGDLLLLTADHGCDPTWTGTDHTRERVPIFGCASGGRGGDVGLRPTFADIGETIAEHLGLPAGQHGTSFYGTIA